MDATLDFVGRARRAWKEFRHPGAPIAHNGMQASQPSDDQAPRWMPDPSLNNSGERTALENFRLLVGIHQDKSFSSPHGFLANRRPNLSTDHRPSPNLGIYSTVCDAEIKSKRNYKSQSRLIHACLGLQLVVAAALTALGAADGNRAAVTVFGAINTVIAGFLTYLKGSGLPQRIKYYQHEWAKVREYIEQRERDFSFGLLGPQHVMGEVETIREMYEAARADIANNTPERFVGNPIQKVMQPGRPTQQFQQAFPVPSMQSLSKEHLNAFDAKQAEATAAMKKAQEQATGLFGRARGLKEMLENKVHDLGEMEKEIESDGRRMATEKKQGLTAQVEQAVQEIAQLGKQLEADATKVAADKRQQVGSAIADSTDALAQQQQAAANSIQSAITNTSDAALNQHRQNLAAAQQDTQRALSQTSQAAGDALDLHRQNLAAAIAPRHNNMIPVPDPSAIRPREGD